MKRILVVAATAAFLGGCGGDSDSPSACEYACEQTVGAGCPNDEYGACLSECNETLAMVPAACRSQGETWMACMAAGPLVCGVDGYAETLAVCEAETAAFFDCWDPPTKPAPR